MTIANWRHWRQFDFRQLAPIAMVTQIFTLLRIANWRCRQLAPIVGANWRHVGANWRQLALIGANNWRQFHHLLAPIAHRQYLAPIGAIGANNWRQLAPVGANLAPIGATDLKFPFTQKMNKKE